MPVFLAFLKSSAGLWADFGWLPDLDLNQNKQIQSLLCYHYTIGQTKKNGRHSRTGIAWLASSLRGSPSAPPYEIRIGINT